MNLNSKKYRKFLHEFCTVSEKAAFESEDPLIIEMLADEFYPIAGCRDELSQRFVQFHNLSQSEEEILDLLENQGIDLAVCLG